MFEQFSIIVIQRTKDLALWDITISRRVKQLINV